MRLRRKTKQVDSRGVVLVAAAMAASAFLTSSAASGQAVDPCAGVSCSGHGMCIPYEGQPACACDPGYEPDPNDTTVCNPERGTPPPEVVQPPPQAPPPVEPPPQAPPPVEPPPQSGWGTPPPEAQPEPPPQIESPQIIPVPAPIIEVPVEAQPPLPVEPPQVDVEPQPPIAATIPVRFTVGWGRQRIAVTSGELRLECLTPCTLELPPGQATIGPPTGNWRSEVTVDVEDHPIQAVIQRTEGRSRRVAGGALLGGGLALMTVGFAIAASQSDLEADPNNSWTGAAYGLTLPGAVAAIVGLVLLAISPESYGVEVSDTPAPPAVNGDEAEAEPSASARRRPLSFASTAGGASFTF